MNLSHNFFANEGAPWIKILRVALVLAFGLAHGTSALAADLADRAGLESFVDGYVESMMLANESPAGTVAITHGGELIFAKGYGFQDLDKRIPVDANKSLFRPGSVSKLFTWVSVMQQVELGKLDLDADVNTYLKTFQIDDTWPGQPITLRHIMTHTPGFEDGGMGYLIIDDPDRIMPLAEAMARYQPYRINPPGAQTSYSNYATALAGLIVANVSGLEFNEYLQKNIFDVLGMRSSTFVEPLPERLAKNMTGTYGVEGGDYAEKPYEIISNFGPAGAMASTSTDMVKFAEAILNGGEYRGRRILKASTTEEMLTRNFSHDDRMMGMCLGFYETEANGFRLVGHGGDTSGFHSELVIDEANDLTFFVSFASSGGSAVRSLFKPAFYNEYFPVPETIPTPPEDFAERAGKYAGAYKFWRGSFSTIEKAMGLQMALNVTPTEDNTLLVGFGGTAKEFAEIEKNLFLETEPMKGLGPFKPAKVAFQEDEAGNITGFVADGMPFMSSYKAASYQTPSFNLTLVAISLLIFLAVYLRFAYQYSAYKALAGGEKSAHRASLITAGSNLLVVIAGAIMLTAVGDKLGGEIPLAFKLWLVLPIIAFLAGIYQLYQCFQVWRQGLTKGVFARLRYTFVTLAALFMCWFYWYWNFLGFQYYT